MQTRSRAFVSFAALLTLATSVNAAPTFYTSRAAYNAAEGTQMATEDFESANLAANSAAGMSGNLDSTTNNALFSTGDIAAGIRFRENAARVTNGLAVASAGFTGLPSTTLFANNFADSLDVTFTQDVETVGFDLYSEFGNSTLTITVFDINGVSATTTVNALNNGTPTFFGVRMDTNYIARININSNTAQAEGIDNIVFNPEPSSWALAALGLGGLLAGARRRRRRLSAPAADASSNASPDVPSASA